MIAFKCPMCRAVLKIADDKAGVRSRRPNCGDSVRIPRPTTVEEPLEVLPADDDAAELQGICSRVESDKRAAKSQEASNPKWSWGKTLFRTSLASATVVLALSLGGVLLADDVVTDRSDSLFGFKAEYEQAKVVLGKDTTSQLDSATVFVTRQEIGLFPGYYYFRSNYKRPLDQYPTTVIANKIPNLLEITAYIYGSPVHVSTPQERSLIRKAHQQIKFVFTRSLFDEDNGKIALESGEAENLYIMLDDSPEPKRLVRINSIRRSSYVAEYLPSLFVHVPSQFAPYKLFTKLEHRPFRVREIRFLSLAADSTWNDAIKLSRLARIREDVVEPSKDKLRELFRRNSGRIVIVLGHVEGESFVVFDASGKTKLLDLPITQVDSMAVATNCDAVLMGCNLGAAGAAQAVDRLFNPIDAVQRIEKALDSENYLEFARKLSGDDLGLVFNETALDHTNSALKLEVYDKESRRDKPDVRDHNRVGRILFGFGIVAPSEAKGSNGQNRATDKTKGHGGSISEIHIGSLQGVQEKEVNPLTEAKLESESEIDWFKLCLAIILAIFTIWVLIKV